VSAVDLLFGDMPLLQCGCYVVAQIVGGILGAVLANIQFDVQTQICDESHRFGWNLWISEVIATATLIFVIHGSIRTGNEDSVPVAVSAWVFGGYFFTSSSIFANPAVTIGRIFSNTFAGISPASAGVYICFQVIGAFVGYGLVRILYPSTKMAATKDDPLYRRAYVLVHQSFYENMGYNNNSNISDVAAATTRNKVRST
jgi:glycerol uptake facilitator-like aquaporin